MAQALRKTAIALSAEPEILTVHADLKEVCRTLESCIKASEQADKSLLYWADRKGEDAGVHEFLTKLVDVNTEVANIDRKYNDHFRIFVKLWKGILAEKKDLNAKIASLKKCRANTDAVRKKMYKEEEKEPRDQDKYTRAKQALTEAEAEENEMMRAVGQKLLEVQQDQHETLRTGYSGLSDAVSSRLKELSIAYDKIRVLVNSLPRVVSRRDDGAYVTEPFPGPFVAPAVWSQGEQLQRELADVRAAHDRQLQSLSETHTKSMHSMAREQEALSSQSAATHTSELKAQQGQHTTLIAQIKDTHASELRAAEGRYTSLIATHDATVAELRNQIALVSAELASRQRDVLAHEADEARLEEEIERLRDDIRMRAIARAQEQVLRSRRAVDQTCIDCGLEALSALRASISDLQQVDPKGPAEVFDAKLSVFSNITSELVYSSVGAARGSLYENRESVLDAARRVEESALALTKLQPAEAKRREMSVSDADTDDEESIAPESLPKCVALYEHEAKVQEGFSLMGFRKGDIMLLIKKRDDGWSKVSKDGVEGWAPSSYLRDLSMSDEDSVSAVEDDKPATPAALFASLKAAVDTLEEQLTGLASYDRSQRSLNAVTAETVTSRVTAAQQSIMDAQGHIAKLKTQAEGAATGRLRDTGLTITERAATLLGCMSTIINLAIDMRGALGASGDSAAHAPWLASLGTAADAVASGCPLMVEAMRCVLAQQGKHEELQVATRTISASVAQLTALSKTKAGLPRGFQGQAAISAANEAILAAAHELLAAVRERHDVELAGTLIADFGKLSENEAKRLIMATQVQVLRLERELEGEREKLGRLRRLTYEDKNSSA